MKRLSFIFLALSTIIGLCACNEPEKEVRHPAAEANSRRLASFDWLSGTWMNRTPDGDVYESWTRLNDSTYAGRSFAVSGRDTDYLETIALADSGGAVYYIPTVGDQNDGEAVYFRLVSDTAGAFVFENLQHDFPQRIIYEHPRADSLHARIEGTVDGALRSHHFYMSRVK